MTGETDIKKLLQGMKPNSTRASCYCTVDSPEHAIALNPLCMFQDDEAVTVIVPKLRADKVHFPLHHLCMDHIDQHSPRGGD
jgi:hypothetical protein